MAPQRHLLMGILWILGGVLFAEAPDPAFGKFHLADPEAAKRGQVALTSRAFTPASFTTDSLATVWRSWTKTKPLDPIGAARERFGLHEAPYPNGDLPMGLRKGTFALGIQGLALDCMVCHGGSILGKSMVGLGNSSLDLQSLFEELPGAGVRRFPTPFHFSRTRGTNEAVATSVYLLALRNPDLSFQLTKSDPKLVDTLCGDVPAWWLMKKKATLYSTGEGDARASRGIMQFSLHPLNQRSFFEKEESTFKDILHYLYSIEAPKYPFSVDQSLAGRGEGIFRNQCAKCHGTYGSNPTYPNKIVPLEDVATDPQRLRAYPMDFAQKFSQSWFSKGHEGWLADGYQGRVNDGYQAPPLDGIWATAPYLHNGSVPTLAHLLDSKTRPTRFTRSYRTAESDYDKEKIGWVIRPVDPSVRPANTHEARKIYDTKELGRSNRGHDYGDKLNEEERKALLEYLKTL